MAEEVLGFRFWIDMFPNLTSGGIDGGDSGGGQADVLGN